MKGWIKMLLKGSMPEPERALPSYHHPQCLALQWRVFTAWHVLLEACDLLCLLHQVFATPSVCYTKCLLHKVFATPCHTRCLHCSSWDQIPGTDLPHLRNCFRHLHLFFEQNCALGTGQDKVEHPGVDGCSDSGAVHRSLALYRLSVPMLDLAYLAISPDCKECEPDISHF